MKRALAFVVPLLAFGFVYCGPLAKRDLDDMDINELIPALPDNIMQELSDWVENLVGPLQKQAERYKKKPVGYEEHKESYETVNGTRMKVETSVRKEMHNGTEFTIIKKTMDDGKNSSSYQGAQEIMAAIAGEEGTTTEEPDVVVVN